MTLIPLRSMMNQRQRKNDYHAQKSYMSLPDEIIAIIFEWLTDEPSWWWPIAASSKHFSSILDHVISHNNAAIIRDLGYDDMSSPHYSRVLAAGPGAIWCLYRNIPAAGTVLLDVWAAHLSLRHYSRLVRGEPTLNRFEVFVVERPDLAIWHLQRPNFIVAMMQRSDANQLCLPRSYDKMFGTWVSSKPQFDRGAIFNIIIGAVPQGKSRQDLGCAMVTAIASDTCGRIAFSRDYIELLRMIIAASSKLDNVRYITRARVSKQEFDNDLAIIRAVDRCGGFCDDHKCRHLDVPAEYDAELERALSVSVPMLIHLLKMMKRAAYFVQWEAFDKVIKRLERA